MVNLQTRSSKKELLDEKNISFDEIRRCMKELNTVNGWLGGHRVTNKAVATFTAKYGDALSVCEIGCGGGDNLNAIDKKFNRAGAKISFTGVDILEECIGFAAEQYPGLNASWVTSNYRDVHFGTKPDVIFSSLFCHHFSDAELVEMLRWLRENSACGFFINDLHRNTVAYYSIKWLTAVFSRSRLVKSDACISVARGFRKKDWQLIFERAGIKHYRIHWHWAFRWLIICKND